MQLPNNGAMIEIKETSYKLGEGPGARDSRGLKGLFIKLGINKKGKEEGSNKLNINISTVEQKMKDIMSKKRDPLKFGQERRASQLKNRAVRETSPLAQGGKKSASLEPRQPKREDFTRTVNKIPYKIHQFFQAGTGADPFESLRQLKAKYCSPLT